MEGMEEYFKLGRQAQGSRWYNGFSPAARQPSNGIQREARRERGDPFCCSMSLFNDPSQPKGRGYLFTHLEDYGKPLDWLPVSKLVHRLLHARFTEPQAWLRYVARHYVHGAWWTLLVMSPRAMFMPYSEIYPIGLPPAGKAWPEVADQWGLSKELFMCADLKETIRHTYRFPEGIAFPGREVDDTRVPVRSRTRDGTMQLPFI